MRYPDGGGLSPAARERRETVRFQAAQLFAQDVAPVEVAARLRVSTKSIYQWRRCWRAGGEAALASTGPGGASCRLSDAQLDRLRTELERGPAEHGWADQRWTLARITTLIGRLFHRRDTPRGRREPTTIGIPHPPGIDRRAAPDKGQTCLSAVRQMQTPAFQPL